MLKPKNLNHGQWWDVWWSPWRGCTAVGAACHNCWAERIIDHGRLKSRGYCPEGFWAGPVYQGAEILKPLHWRKPRVVGVCGFSDLFHRAIPDAQIIDALAVMFLTPQHLYIIPTKRTARAVELLNNSNAAGWTQTTACTMTTERSDEVGDWFLQHPICWPLPNVWLLASVWDQASLDACRVDLMNTQAALRGISYEPALGPIDLTDTLAYFDHDQRAIRWVIAGGESGPGARPSNPRWFRDLYDQCCQARVPFLFKQWGEWAWLAPPADSTAKLADLSGPDSHLWPDGSVSYRAGKHLAGRHLVGVELNGWPGDSDGDSE